MARPGGALPAPGLERARRRCAASARAPRRGGSRHPSPAPGRGGGGRPAPPPGRRKAAPAGRTRATVILGDTEGQLERLEELLNTDRATLVVGALDGGFVVPGLRVLTDHEIFRRARRLRSPRRYREAVASAATR